MVEAIKTFFLKTLGKHLCVFLCSMIPIIELRGAIPIGAGFGLPFWQNFTLSILGNMLPIPFILLFIKAILNWMSKCKIKLFNKVSNWLFAKAEKNRPKIEKYSTWGLMIFVAIPLPGTGAWTGALVASLINMKFSKAILSIFLGVLTAGLIMSAASYGVVGFLKIFM